MAKALTKRQKEFLDYIKAFRAKKGYSPSYREIGKHFGLTSTATIASHVKSLQEKGLLLKNDKEARSLILSEEEAEGMSFGLPILGAVAAGRALDTTAIDQTHETLQVPEIFISKKKHSFVLEVSGDSMKDMGIMDNDYLIVEEREEAKNGETVVAGIGETFEAVVKKFKKEGGIVYLISENEKYEPIRVDTRTTPLKIYGIVAGVIRKY